MYKVMLSAGEASGDLHGAGIAAALRKLDDEIVMLGMGGGAMRSEGVDILYDIAEYSVMGFWEVAKNLPRLFRLKDGLTAAMRREKPDILVIIDYPDFNLRLAKEAKKLGIPVFSYIPPSAWAWRKGRASSVAAIADKVAAIFPFEVPVYEAAGADISFVGNPLLDMVKPVLSKEELCEKFRLDGARPLVLLMPGSRRQEVAALLPIMLESAEKLRRRDPNIQFVLPAAPTISKEFFGEMPADVRVVRGCAYDLMRAADAAVAASGTVTLEAALLGLPAVVIYKMAPVSYWIARRFIDLPNVSLPNIILGKRVIPELLQSDANADKVEEAVRKIMRGTPEGDAIRQTLAAVREKMGGPGAALRTAALIVETIRRSKKRYGN